MYLVENAGRFGSASFSMFNTICGIQNEKPSIVSGQVSEGYVYPATISPIPVHANHNEIRCHAMP